MNVSYRGANASVIETRITQVIENEVAGLEGVDKLTSRSRDEQAQISVQFNTNRDIDAAANDVRDRVTRVAARACPMRPTRRRSTRSTAAPIRCCS